MTASAVFGVGSMRRPHCTSTCVESLQAAQQLGIDQRLDEAVALGPAETCIGRRHFGKDPALGVDEAQDLVGHRVRQDLVDQADRLEGAQRLVVEADPAGVVDQAFRVLRRRGC